MILRFAFVAIAVLVSGCDKIPGTNAHLIKKAERSAANELIDPTSAMFRNESVHGKAVCGEINGKNRMGAYAGFTRYFYLEGVADALIDPQADPSDEASAEDLCTSVQSNEYSSASLIQSACQRAAEEKLKQALQDSFNSRWQTVCEK